MRITHNRGRRWWAALGLVVGLLASSVLPAQAASSWSAPVQLTSGYCDPVQMTYDAKGVGRGVALCQVNGVNALYFVSGSGSTYRRTVISSTTNAARLLDVADDGVATHAMFLGSDEWIRVVSRTRAGTVTVAKVRKPFIPWVTGSLIGYNGKWWAAWNENPTAVGSTAMSIWTARTMLTPYSAHNTGLTAAAGHLSLANRGSSALLVWTAAGTYAIKYGLASGSTFTQITTGFVGTFPSMRYADGVYHLVYSGGKSGHPYAMYRSRTATSGWTGTVLPTTTSADGSLGLKFGDAPRLAISGGVVRVGWTTTNTAGKFVPMLATKAVGKPWVVTSLSDGVSTQVAGTSMRGVVMAGGRTYVVLRHHFYSDAKSYDVVRSR